MNKSQKGITLIALVITIIVLLILAGISISLVTGQNGVLTRAEDASNTYSMSSAKEQANMRAAGYLSEYMEKVYVDNDMTAGAMTTGEYVLAQINGKEDGNYRYSVSGNTITVTDRTTGETLASGTVDENGGISWSDSVEGGSTLGVTIPDDLKTAVENGTSTAIVELAMNSTFDWPVNLHCDEDVSINEQSVPNNYANIRRHLINGNWSSVSNGLYYDPEGGYIYPLTGSYYNTEINPTDEYMDMTITRWRILKINDNNTIDLVPASLLTTKVWMGGAQGYNNGVKLLNDACNSLYGDARRGITARNINIEDIEAMINETETGRTILANKKAQFNYGNTYTHTNCLAPAICSNESTLGISEQQSYFNSRENAKKQYNSLTLTQTAYELWEEDLISALGRYASVLFVDNNPRPTYWIASRVYDEDVNRQTGPGGYFGINCIEEGSINMCASHYIYIEHNDWTNGRRCCTFPNSYYK